MTLIDVQKPEADIICSGLFAFNPSVFADARDRRFNDGNRKSGEIFI